MDKQLQDNPNLLTSSQNQDIVVFLGKTGAGKSTLINYLSGKELAVDNNGLSTGIQLQNPNDAQAMRIGTGQRSETLLPQFIRSNDLILYDLPGFGDTRGTVISLVNAYFIKTLIENARSTRLVFVAGQDELTAGRGRTFFDELTVNIRTLIPNQTIEACSSLVITKASNKSEQNFLTGLLDYVGKGTAFSTGLLNDTENETAQNPLTSWITAGRVTKMSSPVDNTIDQEDKTNILNTIRRANPQQLTDINIAAIYSGEETNK